MTEVTEPTEKRTIIVVVASLNPVKINATLQAFTSMFPPASSLGSSGFITARGVSVPSGVPDQPFSDAETLQGALNRAERAREVEPAADFWVGLEGGVTEDPTSGLPYSGGLLQSFAWVVVLGRESGRRGSARTATYYLPRETAALVRDGVELGPAEDRLWGRTNSKQKNGSVGLLTGDVIDRRGYYEQAVVLALIPFKNLGLTF